MSIQKRNYWLLYHEQNWFSLNELCKIPFPYIVILNKPWGGTDGCRTNHMISKFVLTPSPQNFNLLTKIKKKKMLVSKNFFCCSQNLPKHFLVLKKSMLKPLFTTYRLFFKCKLWGDPPPPLLEKVYISDFFCTLSEIVL